MARPTKEVPLQAFLFGGNEGAGFGLPGKPRGDNANGATLDVTGKVREILGGRMFEVRYPQEDTFGTGCAE